jgi:3-oxoadipate enol-lactonase
VRVRVRGEGPPLLWSHGIFFPTEVDDRSTLGALLGRLPEFTVIRWDARGHGRTPPAPTAQQHAWSSLGADVLHLADALGLERFAVGGISMGAAATLHALVQAPSRVEAALLMALPMAWETRPAEQQRYRDLLAFSTPDALADHVQEELDALFPGRTLPASLRAMVAWMRSSSWEALERVIVGASLSDLPDRAALARLAVPTLLRAWHGDSGHPISTAEALRVAVPSIDYGLLEGFDDEAGMRTSFAELRACCARLPDARLRLR